MSNQMGKVNTIEQYKVMAFIAQNFEMDAITTELVDRCSIKVIDEQGAGMMFECDEVGKINYYEIENENSEEDEWER